ncbi:acetylornithine deacetylase [Maricaulis sp.]|uniref:acetylornithine deacetylase n=1 Tax=Maricaulis sp. TaxID=1486257 RepID=UPI00263A2F72|nr:acetylornithine deacetylase [Maricaulis sp.]MDF1767901.1 acetylornithine deacetylase [Maricaulis sp.]
MSSIGHVLNDLKSLVGFNTVSCNSNIELIDWAENKFEAVNAQSVRIPNLDGTKANLWVRFGPETAGGIVLSGHTDVVPVEGQDWYSDPFEILENDDRIYGRGTADMKTFIAFCTAYSTVFSNAKLNRPVHIALSYDEEVGCTGAPAMIEQIALSPFKPSVAWIGEPTNWKVVSGHKGNVVTRVEVTGVEAHSSQTHLGISAIEPAVKLMSILQGISEDLKTLALDGSLFEPPYPTLTIGQISGGTASNILAHKCEFVFDLRCIAGIEPDTVLAPFNRAVVALNAEIAGRYPEAGVQLHRLCNAPPLAVTLESEVEGFVRRLTGDNAQRAVAYTAEAGQFNEAGMPAVLCGPGSIDQAHRPNEFIEKSEIARGVQVFDTLVKELRS